MGTQSRTILKSNIFQSNLKPNNTTIHNGIHQEHRQVRLLLPAFLLPASILIGLPATLVTRSTKPPLVLPKRPTRTLPRTLTHLSEPVPLPQRTPLVTRLMRARTPHLLRAISRLLPTKHLTQSPRPMISLCNST